MTAAVTSSRAPDVYKRQLLGCAMGCVLLLPAGLSLLQNPRTIDPFNGMGYLVYGKAQQYGAIFYSAFLMPDAPYFKDMFSEGIQMCIRDRSSTITMWLCPPLATRQRNGGCKLWWVR